MRDAVEILIEQATIWSPIHDFIGNNRAHQRDALDYLRGKVEDTPLPPPDFLVEIFSRITPAELAKLKRAANTTEAYEYIKWLHRKRRTPDKAGPEPAMTKPEKGKRKSRGGHKLSDLEVAERYRLAPTMTSFEFARHFGLRNPGSACKWCGEHGLKLRDMRYKAR